ncbi:MAG: sigma-70 family RNA polymerase sigma factor [Planctomycetota bacterium]
MSEQTDRDVEDCVARVRDGDRDGFRGLVDLFLPQVRATIVARSLPGIDVDDVVQRSFVEAYKNIADYKPGINFRAWLLTIARYQLMAESTRLRRVADYHTKYVPEFLARQNQAMLEEDPNDDERLSLLAECLKELPDSAREVLRLRYEDDCSHSEISDVVDRSAGAIRKQLCLLRQQLHQCVSLKLSTGDNHAS